jgi:hypothetical protein
MSLLVHDHSDDGYLSRPALRTFRLGRGTQLK